MVISVPDLKNLQAFEAVGRLGGYKAAAEELNLTPSALSHRVAALESALGETLFQPDGRSVALTQIGRTYLASVRQVFEQLNVATDQIKRRGVSGLFTVRVHPSIALYWLIPRLPRFLKKYPDLELQVITASSPADFSSSETDVAIDMVDLGDAGYVCDFLFSSRDVVAICSPQYAKLASRELRAPRDLLKHKLIYSALRQNEWQTWFESLNIDFRPSHRAISVSSRDAAIEAAAAGMGVALASPPLVNVPLQREHVVELFRSTIKTGYHAYLITTQERAALPRVEAFRQWLTDDIALHV